MFPIDFETSFLIGETVSFWDVVIRTTCEGQKLLHFQALQAFDRECTGKVTCSDFRRVLDNFCFKLSDDQFKELAQHMTLDEAGKLLYAAFLDTFTGVTISVRFRTFVF